jgi:Ser/Thr protein kinase RdoA (MazF antagonist)
VSDTPTEFPVFAGLEPDIILDAVDRYGLQAEGGLLALNSYENRVYKVECADAPVVVKFYRPGRWSDVTILEEHEFALELAEHEIPVVAPLAGPDGNTLQHFEGFRYAVFPCQGGRAAELNVDEDWRQMGRFIARIHAVGARQPFAHRATISMQEFGYEPVEYVLSGGFLPAELETPYRTLTDDLLAGIATVFEQAGNMHAFC